MKHTFKVGDGMTTENSTAEERIEIFQLLKDNGYKASLYLLEDCDLTEMGFFWFEDNSFWAETEPYKGAITNPLTYEQMKNYILGVKWNWKDAINAVKDGSHAVEMDVDNKDFLISFLLACFPKDLQYDYEKDTEKCFIIGNVFSGITKKRWGHYNPKNLPTIHLSNIKEPNDLQSRFEALEKEIAVLKEAIKPVSLEVGKWYKNINYLICYIGNGKCYGIRLYDGVWLKEALHNETSHIAGNYQPATPAEVTEALKKEAVKSGLVKGARIKSKFTGWVKNNLLFENKHSIQKGYWMSECRENDFIGFGVLLMRNGKWATVVETISLKDAEKELGKKIIV